MYVVIVEKYHYWIFFILELHSNYRASRSHPDSSRLDCDDDYTCLSGSKNLKHDPVSGKILNNAVHRIILDGDPEESGVYAVNDGKICKSKSFPKQNK